MSLVRTNMTSNLSIKCHHWTILVFQFFFSSEIEVAWLLQIQHWYKGKFHNCHHHCLDELIASTVTGCDQRTDIKYQELPRCCHHLCPLVHSSLFRIAWILPEEEICITKFWNYRVLPKDCCNSRPIFIHLNSYLAPKHGGLNQNKSI